MSESPDLSPVQSCLDLKGLFTPDPRATPQSSSWSGRNNGGKLEVSDVGSSLTEANPHRLGLHPLNTHLRGGVGGWGEMENTYFTCLFLINCHYLVKIFVYKSTILQRKVPRVRSYEVNKQFDCLSLDFTARSAESS